MKKFNLILDVIFFLLFGLLIGKVLPFKMIPVKYFVFILVFIVSLFFIIILFYKFNNKVLRWVHFVFILVLIFLLGIGYYYLDNTLLSYFL